MSSTKCIFQAQIGFCSECGSILPPLRDKGSISCYTCQNIFTVEAFQDRMTKYTIHFNAKDIDKDLNSKKQSTDDEGPIVDRKCPRCGNEKMSYATLQLRSADEGQTVFYTCVQCKFRESENS
ncbi:hypothetical protein HHI36_013581 [Cryptolaemus montrouzieri]|uniref:DNA-directed RNA polymerase subunit n=1 Tax=Cryptolaemus montrouzieri TaxID=559131 RepID=A0ABD2NHU3_9CUCU